MSKEEPPFMFKPKFAFHALILSTLLVSCSGQALSVVVEKEPFEKASALSLSSEAAEALRTKEISSADTILSENLSVESSVYDGQKKGIRLSEAIQNKKDGGSILSSYAIKAYSQTGKSVTVTGNCIYDANKNALQIAQDGSNYYLPIEGMGSSFSVNPEQGKTYANAIEKGQSQYNDAMGFIRVGYTASNLVAVTYQRTNLTKTGENQVENCVAGTMVYEEFGSTLRIKQNLMYLSVSFQSPSLSYFASSYVTNSFGYEGTEVSKSIDDALPAYDKPYIYAMPTAGFGFLPYVDTSSLFNDGKDALMVASYVAGYGSSLEPVEMGHLDVGLIHGQSDKNIGEFAVFASRLANIA